ncbi:MAG: hypothetical protein IH859_01985 [Chloroflexi bacterium]|nr:hypothetical protein [Chloroflexota bacterium]
MSLARQPIVRVLGRGGGRTRLIILRLQRRLEIAECAELPFKVGPALIFSALEAALDLIGDARSEALFKLCGQVLC